MSVRSAQSITVEFTTSNPATQAAVNADSLPAGTLIVNGVDNAASVTVTNIDTGRYKAAVTLPTLAVGDIVELSIAATVSAVAGKAIVWRDTKDLALDASYRPGIDWSNVGAPTTTLALTGTTIAATQKVDVDTIKTNPVVNAGTVTFPVNETLASTTNITAGTITTVTNQLTAAQIATGIWQDTTAGDFAVASSPGKILVTQLGGAFTTTSSSVFTVAALANGPTGGSAPTVGQIATAVWQDATAGDFTTAGSIGKSLYTSGILPGAAGGHFIAGTNAATVVTTSLTTTFTGNLTGNVGGNVTGSVGSVAGNVVGSVGGDLAGSVQGSVVGKVLGVSGSAIVAPGVWAFDDAGNALATLSGQGTILTNLATVTSVLGNFTATGVNTVLGFFKALLSKTATLPSDVGGTFDPTTDSTEAIRDRGDVAWVTGTGTSTFNPTTDGVFLADNVQHGGTNAQLYLGGNDTVSPFYVFNAGSAPAVTFQQLSGGTVSGMVVTGSGGAPDITANIGGNLLGTIDGLTPAGLATLFTVDSTKVYADAVPGSPVFEIASNAGGGGGTVVLDANQPFYAPAIAGDAMTLTAGAIDDTSFTLPAESGPPTGAVGMLVWVAQRLGLRRVKKSGKASGTIIVYAAGNVTPRTTNVFTSSATVDDIQGAT